MKAIRRAVGLKVLKEVNARMLLEKGSEEEKKGGRERQLKRRKLIERIGRARSSWNERKAENQETRTSREENIEENREKREVRKTVENKRIHI